MYAFVLRFLLLAAAVTAETGPGLDADAWHSGIPAKRQASGCALKDPLPDDSVCGMKGSLELSETTDFHIFAEPQVVGSVHECRNFCANRANPNKRPKNTFSGKKRFDICKGFSFNEESNLCKLYPHLPTGNFTQSDSSQDTFYQFQCYDCPLVCPTVGEANLLDNPGFDMSNQYIGPWYIIRHGSLVKTGTGKSRSNAIFCAAGLKCKLKQYRRLCFGQTYQFSMDIKVDDTGLSAGLPPTTIEVIIGDLSQEVDVNGLSEFNDASGYVTVKGTFLANQDIIGYLFKSHEEATAIKINILPAQHTKREDISLREPTDSLNHAAVRKRANSPGIFLDNFSIVAAAKQFTTTGLSVLKNGGFETGSMKPWTFSYFIIDDYGTGGKHEIISPGISGNYAFRRNYSHQSGFNLLQRNVPLVTGRPYLLSFDFTTSKEADVGRDFRPGAQISYPGSNGTQEWGFAYEYVPLERSPFQRVFIALGKVADISATIFPSPYACDAKPNGCMTVIDNIEVRELDDGGGGG